MRRKPRMAMDQKLPPVELPYLCCLSLAGNLTLCLYDPGDMAEGTTRNCLDQATDVRSIMGKQSGRFEKIEALRTARGSNRIRKEEGTEKQQDCKRIIP